MWQSSWLVLSDGKAQQQGLQCCNIVRVRVRVRARVRIVRSVGGAVTAFSVAT
jgi:hypothetical protein